MSVSGVSAAGSASTTTASSTSASKSQVLDQDAFLRLLVTQLQNQDPLSPMEDTEFIAQLAQFSALEQMNQVRQEVENMRNEITAINLLGKTVKYQAEDGTVAEGVVESVKNLGSTPILTVSGDRISLSDISEVLTAE